MSKILKTILIISIAVVGFGFSFIPSTWAVQSLPLIVEFENTPLFSEANFLPGDNVVRWVKVLNNTDQTQSVAAEAINYPGFPDSGNVPVDDLSRALLLTIREKGGSDLYGGSAGQKHLFDFYSEGETYLSDISAGSFKEYEFEIAFPKEKENEWQGKTTSLDILIGFQGTEGGGEDGDEKNGGETGGGPTGGGPGGGEIPPGLTITNEAEADVEEVSVIIVWETNYPATSLVIYAEEGQSYSLDLSEPNYGYPNAAPVPEDTTKVTSHSVTISGLTPGTTYYYRCVSHASLAISQQHSFTTEKTDEEKEPPNEGAETPPEESDEEEGGAPEEGQTPPVEGQLAEGTVSQGESSGTSGRDNVVGGGGVVKGPEGETEDLSKLFLASIEDTLSFGNPLRISLLFLIILIILLFLRKRKKKKKQSDQVAQ